MRTLTRSSTVVAATALPVVAPPCTGWVTAGGPLPDCLRTALTRVASRRG